MCCNTQEKTRKNQTVAHYTINPAHWVFNQLIWIFNIEPSSSGASEVEYTLRLAFKWFNPWEQCCRATDNRNDDCLVLFLKIWWMMCFTIILTNEAGGCKRWQTYAAFNTLKTAAHVTTANSELIKDFCSWVCDVGYFCLFILNGQHLDGETHKDNPVFDHFWVFCDAHAESL